MAVSFMLATAVVQANHQMNMLKDGPSMMKNPSAMLTELEGMVRSGEAPTFDLINTIKSLIEDEIMPGLQITRDAAAEATADALREIQSCNNESKTEEGKIEMSRQVSVDTARSLHAACREAQQIVHEHNLTDAASYCVKLGELLVGATPLEITAGDTRAEMVKYVKDASFVDMCALAKVTEADNGCTASEAELEDKKAECSANQRSFESEFCTWKTELESNCKTLDTCHSAAVTAYDSHVAKTQTLGEKWNVETAALQKILCYCNVWLSEKDCDNRSKHNATQFEVCKDQTHSPGLVNYGTPAAKVACLLTSVDKHPGTSGFVTQEYASFTDFVESVIPCTEATTAMPTL